MIYAIVFRTDPCLFRISLASCEQLRPVKLGIPGCDFYHLFLSEQRHPMIFRDEMTCLERDSDTCLMFAFL